MAMTKQQALALASARLRLQEAEKTQPVVSPEPVVTPEPKEPSFMQETGRAIARGVPSGLASLPLLVGEAATYLPQKLYESIQDRPVSSERGSIEQAIFNPSDAFQSGLNEIGIKTPETPYGRVLSDAISGVTGAAGGVSLGRQLVNSASPRLAALGNILSTAPKSQALAGGAAGVAAGSTREMGGSPEAQLLAGVLAGSVAPSVATSLFNKTKNIIAPMSSSMTQSRILRQLKTVLGDDYDTVMSRLSAATTAGSAPITAGEVAGVPAISTLQRTAMQTNPQIAQRLGDVMKSTSDDVIDRLRAAAGGTADDLEAARRAATERAYQSVSDIDVPLNRPFPDRIAPSTLASNGEELAKDTGLRDFLTNLTKTKTGSAAMAHAVDVAKNRAAAAGLNPDEITGVIPSDPTAAIKGAPLMDIKKAIAELIEKKPEGLSTNSLNVLQKAYQGKLREYFPEYKTVDDLFAAMSRPVDQAKILEEIQKRGLDAWGEAIQPRSFARAIGSKTLPKTATGSNYASWKDLTPAQRKIVADTLRFAKGRDILSTAGKSGGGSDTAQKAAYSAILEGAGLPAWLSGAMSGKTGGISKGLEMLYRDAAVNRSADVLSELLADPVKMAQAMRGIDEAPIPLLDKLRRSAYPSIQSSTSATSQ